MALNLGLGLALTRNKGVPFRLYINGVLFERITDDDTGAFLTDDDTGLPLYDEVA